MTNEAYERAFNIVVKYGFCGDCRWGRDSKHCHECDCYENGVKPIREAIEHMKEPKPSYRGYTATVEYDEDEKLWWGQLDGIKNTVCFHAFKEEEVEAAFHNAVDDYIAFMEKIKSIKKDIHE